MIFFLTSLMLVVLMQSVNTALISPCPEVFSYRTSPDLPDRWYGKIQVSEDIVQVYNWVYVELDRTAHLFPSLSGSPSTKNFKEFLIEKRDYYSTSNDKLKAQTYEFVTSYDYAQPIPRVKVIRVNGQEICRENNAEIKSIPGFPTRPSLPNKLLLAKMNATGYVPDFLEINRNSTSSNTQ